VLVKNQIGTSAKTKLCGEVERIPLERFVKETNSFFGKVALGGLPVALSRLMREFQLHQTLRHGMMDENINGYLESK
jgi:hypothetical protein